MKFAVFSALTLLISAVSAFHIVPPGSIVTCDPLTVSYDIRTGLEPISLVFHNGSETGPVIAGFTNVTGTSYTWDKVTIPAGTNVVIVLADSKGVGSATPVITVTAGSSDVCLNNPTSIPPLPTITSESPPTSSIGSSDLSAISSSLSSLSSTSSLSTTTTTPGPSTDLSSSLSSLSSVISSASSLASSLTVTTTSRAPGATGGLSDNGAITRNAVGVFTISVISAFAGALLA